MTKHRYRSLFGSRQKRRRLVGFTLVELVIVMAISSLLAVIAFLGQHQLQARARFDAAVNKTIQNIAYARNFAQSNVNAEGSGTNTGSVFVGVGIEFDNNHPAGYPVTEMEPVYAVPDAAGNPDPATYLNYPQGGASCPNSGHPVDADECFEQFFSLPDDFRLTNSGATHVSVFFINTAHGMQTCHDIGTAYLSIQQACLASVGTPVDIDLVDPEGYTTTLEVDPVSGYAKRLN